MKRKFDSSANAKTPTGDPNCPPHVRQAKYIRRDILTKAELTASADPNDLSSADDEAAGGSDRGSTGEVLSEVEISTAFASDSADRQPASAGGRSTPVARTSTPAARAAVPRNRDEAIVQGMQAMAAAIQGSVQYDELRGEIREMRTTMMEIMRLMLGTARAAPSSDRI